MDILTELLSDTVNCLGRLFASSCAKWKTDDDGIDEKERESEHAVLK